MGYSFKIVLGCALKSLYGGSGDPGKPTASGRTICFRTIVDRSPSQDTCLLYNLAFTDWEITLRKSKIIIHMLPLLQPSTMDSIHCSRKGRLPESASE
jgi:hypothetical protein